MTTGVDDDRRGQFGVHVDLLGWFHVIWGVFGALAGASLAVLAIGSYAAVGDPGAVRALSWLFATTGFVLIAFGAANVAVGRTLHRRRALGRTAALALGIPNLVVVPFGTALGIYCYWVLLRDEARVWFAEG
jgi:hypothetical protein